MLAGLCSVCVCVCVCSSDFVRRQKKTHTHNACKTIVESSGVEIQRLHVGMWGEGREGVGACFAVQEPADFGIDDDPPTTITCANGECGLSNLGQFVIGFKRFR